MYRRAPATDSGRGKIGLLDLRFDEFLHGSLSLVRRLTLLITHVVVLSEYVEYLELLCSKKREY